jgi:uncharacterized protein (DUF2062 family)
MTLKEQLKARLYAPLVAQLRQGLTPNALTATVLVGMGMGITPILGVSTMLCAGLAAIFRLNQVAIQVGNYVVYALQFALLLPFIRAGEWMFGDPPLPLSIHKLADMLATDLWGTLVEFGTTLFHAVVAWAVLTPPACVVLFFLLRPLFARVAARFNAPRQAPITHV